MPNRCFKKYNFSEISERKGWFGLRYIPFLLVVKRLFEIHVNSCKDMDNQRRNVQYESLT
jgi:hypothetical protein